jgi:hypothetical protein
MGWKLPVTVVLSLAGIFTFAIIVVLLVEALTQNTIAIAPIAVPKMLADNGYPADVAAQQEVTSKNTPSARPANQESL